MTTGVDPIVFYLIIFVLAIFVGYHVVWSVTPALHTPLMSVTNAISAIILVGAMLAAGPAAFDWGGWVGVAAVGMAAVLIAIAAIHDPAAFSLPVPIPTGNKLELFIGTFIGAITFSGSVIAFGKLSGKIRSASVVFPGQHWVNLLLAVAMIASGIWFFLSADESKWTPYIVMTAIAFVLGVLIIIPIGGADMPVVISMLNSYSGWAAAGIGFSLNNPMLI